MFNLVRPGDRECVLAFKGTFQGQTLRRSLPRLLSADLQFDVPDQCCIAVLGERDQPGTTHLRRNAVCTADIARPSHRSPICDRGEFRGQLVFYETNPTK